MPTRAEKPSTPASPGLLDLEEMWKALLACDWRSLAVVPTDAGVSVQAVVDALRVASPTSPRPVHVVDARGVDVAEGKRLAKDLPAGSADRRTVVVVDALTSSLSGVHLAQGVGSVLLVVRVGAMDLDALTSTVSILGSDRIVGSVTVPPAQP